MFNSGIDAAVRERARRTPGETAVVDPFLALSWKQLEDAGDRAAGVLAEMGVGPDARVGWVSLNRAGYPAYLLGAWRRRASLVGLNWRMPPSAIKAAAESVGISHMVVASQFAHLVGELVPDDASYSIHNEHVPPAPGSAEIQALAPEPGDEGLVYFTSGSTGLPKAVPLTRAAIEATQPFAAFHEFTEGARSLTIPPMFHAAGATWVNYGLTCGVIQYFSDDTTAAGIANTLAEQHITHAILVPTLIYGLVTHLRASPRTYPALQHIGYGASPIPLPFLREALEVLDCDFCQVYGMTEAGGGVAFLPPQDHRDLTVHNHRLAAAGILGEGMEVSVRDPLSGTEVPPGRSGELWFRAPCMTTGYIGRPEETATLIVDGWLNSRDVGYLDKDGYLYVQGRSDDMILSGGENVYPTEVENVLASIPNIEECTVVGVPDERWGQRVVAAVVASADLSETQVQEQCREQLPGYKVPREVRFVTDLPRTPTGKVIRSQLARQ